MCRRSFARSRRFEAAVRCFCDYLMDVAVRGKTD